MRTRARTSEQITAEIQEVLGYVPALFAPIQSTPQVYESQWQQALVAYVSTPLPALLREQLFAYLSRYCRQPYCLVCHSCALRPLGMSGPAILALLEAPAPVIEGEGSALLVTLRAEPGPIRAWPEPSEPLFEALYRAAVCSFTRSGRGGALRTELRRIIGSIRYSQLVSLLLYMRWCHSWVETHPEIQPEADPRVEAHLGPLLEEEPRLRSFFSEYRERVATEERAVERRLASQTPAQGLPSHQSVGAKQLEKILQTLGTGIIAQDATGRLVFANEAAAKVCGFGSVSALLAAPSEAIVQNDLYDESGHPVQSDTLPGDKVVRGELSAELTVRMREPTGGPERWRSVRAAPVRSETGQLELAVSFFSDITDRKRAEERQRLLARASQLLASTLGHTEMLDRLARLGVPTMADWCAVHLVQENGSLQPVALAHGDAQKEALAWQLHRRYPPLRDDPEGLAKVARTAEPEFHPEIPDWVLAGIAHDAEHLTLLRELGLRSGLAVPLIARDRVIGTFTFAYAESGRRYTLEELSLAEDIAARTALAVDNARLLLEAKQAARAREDLLAIVAHDLKNPISAILMNAEYLLRPRSGAQGTAQDRSREQLQVIRRAAGRVGHFIEELLSPTAADGIGPLDRALHDVAGIVDEAIELLDLRAAQKSLALSCRVPESLAPLSCDRDRVLRVLWNLIGNAIKFTPEGGTVHIEVESQPGELRFMIRDTGPGISPPELSSMFAQSVARDAESRRPTGLGLFIAKGIVQAHGGTLWAESCVGEGSAFFFTLPTAPPPPPRPDLPAPDEAIVSKRN